MFRVHADVLLSLVLILRYSLLTFLYEMLRRKHLLLRRG